MTDVPSPIAATAALAISLSLHAALLAVAMLASVPSGTPSEIIRIALVNGGGGRAGHGGGARAPAVVQPQAPALIAEPVPQRPVVKADRQPVPPGTRRRKPDPESPRHEAAPHARIVASDSPARTDLATTKAVGQAPSNEPGTGTGVGTGGGSGSGSGAGSGSGSGNGPGSGAAGLRAYCLSCPEPQYPRIARTRGWQGVVDVDLVIRPDGTVDRAAVARSSGHPALDDAALAVARRSRFQLADTVPAGVRGRIAYGFRLTPTQ